MNINMQESYWGADVAGISEVFGPLMKFIKGVCASGFMFVSLNVYAYVFAWRERRGCICAGEGVSLNVQICVYVCALTSCLSYDLVYHDGNDHIYLHSHPHHHPHPS